MQPLVSVVVTCYNHARFIVQSLDSVATQTYRNFELIVIDDCSSDDSVAVIERWIRTSGLPVTFIAHERNQGVCRSMNEGLELLRGDYVAVNSSDDVWMPEKLAKQVRAMEAASVEVGAIYSDAYLIHEHGGRLPGMFIERQRHFERPPQGRIFADLLLDNFIPAVTVMLRRECQQRVGKFDEEILYEDWDYWLQVSQRYDFIYSPYVSCEYRLVQGSASAAITTRVVEDRVRILVKPWHTDRRTERLLRRRLRVAAGQLFARDEADRLEFIRMALKRDRSIFLLILYSLARVGFKGGYVRGWGRRIAMALHQS
jgi:glycosyltransferase involved in cell wall biosynthesis